MQKKVKKDVKIKEIKNMDFEKLSPIDDVDITSYEEALDFVLKNDDVNNVALSGTYGSGKSSIMLSYLKKHKDVKYLNISLAHFKSSSKSHVKTNSNTEENVKVYIENKIINQLLHQLNPKKIKATRFKIK